MTLYVVISFSLRDDNGGAGAGRRENPRGTSRRRAAPLLGLSETIPKVERCKFLLLLTLDERAVQLLVVIVH